MSYAAVTIFKKAIVITMAFLFLSVCQAQDTTTDDTTTIEKSHILYLSLGDQNNVPSETNQEIFDCTDKVYAVVELTAYPVGEHHLSVRWSDPSDSVREHTQYKFQVRSETTRLWAWLSLSRGFGSGMLQWVNPAAGLEDFIGIWEIDVKIDGKPIGKDKFEVSC